MSYILTKVQHRGALMWRLSIDGQPAYYFTDEYIREWRECA